MVGAWAYFEYVANPRTVRELTQNSSGERAGKVMLLTLPSLLRGVGGLFADSLAIAAGLVG